jgi:hypothetical protein
MRSRSATSLLATATCCPLTPPSECPVVNRRYLDARLFTLALGGPDRVSQKINIKPSLALPYLMWTPEMAREMIRRWISLVPSNMV